MRVRFGTFTFDSRAGQLRGNDRPIPLSGKAFAVLHVLLERRPDVVTKDELMQRVWPGTYVTEANLSVAVSQVRRALGDDAQEPRFIRTHSRNGYAFFAEVVDLTPERRDERPRASTKFWLDWNGRRLLLSEGENIVGRDPQYAVWVDEPRVSARHARITVSADTVILEDLGSTNRTFLAGSRVTSPTQLANGDVIRFGATEVTFKVHQPKTVPVPPRRHLARP